MIVQKILANGCCLCRKVRYSISAPIRNLCYCHCESCRRAVGSAFVAWGTVDANAFDVVAGHMRIVKSSADVSRGFCADCGTSLTYQRASRSSDMDFTLATLEDPSRYAPEAHIWVQNKLSWVQINDGLPQYQTVIS
jgi:hypothetical protein